MRVLFAVFLIFLFSSASTYADILSVHCPLGCPSNPENNDLLFGHVYALSNNPNTKFADWVAYEVNVLNFGDSPGRAWKTDPLLDDSETLEANDYSGANSSDIHADRGHQAPLASFAGSPYWSELNYLSNITPQHENLNRGPWKNLEDAVRDAVSFRKPLYVITGTIYTLPILQLPNANEPHKIPSAYFKIVYDLKGRAMAFLMHQSESRDRNYCDTKISIDLLSTMLSFSIPTLNESSVLGRRLKC